MVAILGGAMAAALAVTWAAALLLAALDIRLPAVLGTLNAGVAALGLMQAGIIGAVLGVAAWHGGRRREVLSLQAWPPAAAWAIGIGVMAAVLVPYNLATWLFSPETFTQDLRPFAKLAHSDGAWLALIVVGIGAPVSEELMFRGFLLPALANDDRLGFVGAALLSTAGWTLLHVSYSITGLGEVFAIGLLFCWLMWRFGSLWLVMGLHAFYNCAQMIALMMIPL